MLGRMLENTTSFANERPSNGECLQCKKSLEPYLRPAFMGLSARWFPPGSFCSECEGEKEIQEKIISEQKLLDEAFKNSRMSIRFKHRLFENFVPEPNTQKAYEISLNYQPKNNGLLFLGACGVGKTHLAASIANSQIGKMPVLFISCPDFLFELRECINKKAKPSHLFDLARRVQLLILDDIGAEKSSEWVQETLFVLINYRYECMLPTIFTSNCNLEELEEKLGQRIVSRIIEMCRCVRMGGEDWRVKKVYENRK